MPNTIVSFRLSDELIERLDHIAHELSKKARGAKVSRTEALRLCVDRGLPVLEEELISKPPPARKR